MATRKPSKTKETPTGQTLHLHVGGTNGTGVTDEDEDRIAELDAEEGGALTNAIAQLKAGGGVKVDVFRILPTERQGFCKGYNVAAFSIDRVAADYGPGTYRVKFKDASELYLKGGTLRFDIAEGVGPPPGAQPGSMQEFLAWAKDERDRERLEREKTKSDWFEWAKLLAPIVGPKLLDIIGGSRSNLTDMIRAVKDLKDLQAPGPDLTAQFSQVVNILQGAKELVGDGGSQTGSTWVDLVRDMLQSPAVGQLAQGLLPGVVRPGGSSTARPPTQIPSQITASAPTPSAPNSVSAPKPGGSCATSAGNDSMLEQLNWLKVVLADLLVQAAKGSNPRLYAEVVIDNLPDVIKPRDLLERLSAPNWWSQLTLIEQRVTEHQDWFTRFRDATLKLLLRKERRAVENTLASNANVAPPGPGDPGPGVGLNQPRPDLEEQPFE